MKKSNPKIWISKTNRRGSFEGAVRYFDEHRAEVMKNLRLAQMYYSVEAIHDLRVEVKRIRALLRLVQNIFVDGESENLGRELKHLFKAAGRLRDIDVQQEIVGQGLKRGNLSEYFNYLKLMENALRPGLGEACHSFRDSLLDETLHRLEPLAQRAELEATRDKFWAYLNSQLDELVVLSQQARPTVDQLHRIRKLAKTVRYTLEVWCNCYGNSVPARALTARLKRLHTLLGEWHDLRVLADSLRLFLDKEADGPLFDSAAYQTFQTGLEQRQEKLLIRYRDAAATLAAVHESNVPSTK